MFDAIEFRGKAQATVEELAANSAVPVYNGLTDEWHPTQMLADFLTMTEHSGKPAHELAYCFMGDGRFNMGRSLLVTGAILGADVRICAPEALWPDKDVAGPRPGAGRGVRRPHHADRRPRRGAAAAPTSCTPTCGSPWGSRDDVWKARVEELTPYQVNAAALERTGNPRVRFMHCLPAFHDTRHRRRPARSPS